MSAHTPTPVDAGALRILKAMAAANAREGLASYAESVSLHSMCDELLRLRKALESIRCRSSALAKKTSVEIRQELHGIHADAVEALATTKVSS